MKLTTQQENEILQVYHAYWDNYIKGNVEAMHPLLADEYTQVGSAESEVFFNKKDAVQFLYDTIEQVAGKLEMRNRKTTLEQQEHSILIHEFCDLFALADDNWIFYSKFRASTFMQQKPAGWKITHQHSSFPDTKAEDGQNIAIDKIAAENLQLREAVKRRTIELEQKNRELEIETSLEKVRAEALGMKKPDDILAICKVMFTELQSLGFSQLRNTLINFWDDNSSSLIDYDYSNDTGGNKANLAYSSHPVFEQFQQKIKNSKDAFAELIVTEDQLESWKQRRRDSGEYEDTRLNDITALYYYFYSIGVGAIGISTFSSITHDQLNVLKRFRNVFDFAYRRYADVAQAEAQTKEAEIQLALERVRARSMAMHKSEELADLSLELVKQVQALGVATWFCAFNIYDDTANSSIEWGSNGQGVFSKYRTPREAVFLRYYEAGQRGETLLINEIGEDQCPAHYEYLCSLPGVGDDLLKMKAAGIPFPKQQIDHVAFFKHGYIIFITYEPVPETHDIFKRFARVFEQSYTRFLDLKNAESQAREAEIELALERVRARAMAMQQSDELREVVMTIYEQLQHLDFNAQACNIVIADKITGDREFWVSGFTKEIYPESYKVPYINHPYVNEQLDAWKLGEKYAVYEYAGQTKKDFDAIFFSATDFKNIPDDAKRMMIELPSVLFSTAFFNYGSIQALGNNPLSTENADILKRFAKVFEQTYTRFLDLQKAEGQAREAQIEAALEKVRGRSLAMHKSDELNEVVAVLFEKLKDLQIPATAVGIGIYMDGTKDLNSFVCGENETGLVISNYLLPYFKHKIPEDFNKVREEQLDLFVGHYLKEEKDAFYEYLFEHTATLRQLPEDIKQTIFESPFYTITMVAVKNALFVINDFEGKNLSENEIDIIQRFARVFDQSYTRFLDLKKAEAQAREAQIDAALERVRSQSMGMQSSKDFSKVTTEMFNQLRQFGGELFATGIVFCDKHKGHVEQWHSLPDAGMLSPFIVPVNLDYIHQYRYDQWKKGVELFKIEIPGDFIEQHFKDIFNLPSAQKVLKDFEARNTPMPETPAWEIDYGASFKHGYLLVSSLQPFKEAEILPRFAKVFEQTYTRFLDLQKAEAQTREAQIEAALERVRSRSMAMHKSDELLEAGEILFLEMQKLGIESLTAGLVLMDKEEKNGLNYTPDPSTKKIMSLPVIIPHNETIHMQRVVENWKKGTSHYVVEMDEQETIQHQTFIAERSTNFTLNAEQLIAISPARLFLHNFYFKEGYLLIVGGNRLSAEQMDIMLRFAKVFQQTYTRFLDLQKAEAQAREAEIELGLERVRARAMAMQKSDELSDLVDTVFKELTKLDFALNWCIINIIDEPSLTNMVWAANPETSKPPESYLMKFEDYPFHHSMLKGYRERKTKHVYVIEGKEKTTYDDYLFGETEWRRVPKAAQDASRAMKRYVATFSFSNFGGLQTVGEEYLSEENLDILSRFGKVFDLTYTRFNDLQKAEAQAREAQIEAALERVRSRTMAMQRSEELPEVAGLLFQQVKALGVPQFHCGFNIFEIDDKECIWYPGSADGDILPPCKIPLTEHPVFINFIESRKRGDELCVYEKKGEYQAGHYRYMLSLPVLGEILQNMLDAGISFPTFQIDHLANFSHGNLLFITSEHFPEMHDTFKRFAKVFEQTYTRFLDLQKAEAQAREAQIEAALERVRSKTMAMHNSNDVGESVAALFDELTTLGLLTAQDRCGIGIMQSNQMMELWTAENATGKTALTIGHLDMRRHTLLQNVYQNWFDKKETYQYILEGEDKLKYYEAMREQANYKIRKDYYSSQEKIVHTDFFFKEGCLYVFSQHAFTADATSIFTRFVNLFGQTYRRYLDLQKAEAQAREAQIETALEKVRSRTLAMQKSDELAETAAVLFQQLITLGIEPNRLYITIIHGETDQADFWITNEDGSRLTDAYAANLEENSTFKKMYEGWKKQLKHLVIDMQGEELQNYFRYLQSRNVPFKGGLEQKRRVQHLAYFSKGFIGMASPEDQPAETLQLLERFAAVFNLTFTRFNDLKIAEAHAMQAEQDLIAIKEAKQKAEDALIELQATQKQLIQSEKMASLGELTAGIAHEIQNPLNFVNNFSEVSGELIIEMVEEVDKGNFEEVKAIADDLKQNLEKINHHGKRAGDIVKGMLQHSSSGSGKKEPANINKLADEYLRLAYHGLRAKDKRFNATLKTDYDETIGNINIIPQDIGRVILNLITNAFYVVAEKSKQGIAAYDPTVSVRTKRVNGKVEISVKDNGNGIPESIREKIFQPFFTTKPTGQGTGLGLSLSYDIVKAHGGALKVETKEGEGTEFIIDLPINTNNG